ncbi:MAG: hypothetical protein ACE5FD_08100 [Anaerolineae bacterium]
MKKQWIYSLALAVLIVWLLPGLVRAHGEPVIAVAPVLAPAGGEITVTGTEMEDGEVFALSLEGVATSVLLGEAAVVDEGFEVTFTIPVDTPPGSYRVQAMAGEETAVADLTVTPAVTADEADEHAEEPLEPSAEPMALDRPQSALQMSGIIVTVLISLGLGFWLIRR